MSEQGYKDPFNAKYALLALVTLLAFPLLHVICGWTVFYL